MTITDTSEHTTLPDLDRIDGLIAWAEAEAAKPEDQRLWDQRDYRTVKPCGTAYCIAGKVAAEDGFDWGEHDSFGSTVSAFAIRRLGITEEDAWGDPDDGDPQGLFDERNTIADLRAARDRIAERTAAMAGAS